MKGVCGKISLHGTTLVAIADINISTSKPTLHEERHFGHPGK